MWITLQATIGMLLILGLWLSVQSLCRRASELPPGADPLAGRLGCGGGPCPAKCQREPAVDSRLGIDHCRSGANR